MWKSILIFSKEVFFPRQCFFCKKNGAFLCPDCAVLLEISSVHRPDRSLANIDDIYAPCSYKNPFVKKIVGGYKYEPFAKDLCEPLAHAVISHFELLDQKPDLSEAMVIPVPLAEKRWRWRGFNQAELLAREIAQGWRLAMDRRALVKVRDTEIQAEQCKQKRLSNIKGAFACPDNTLVRGRTILLVDDIVTTGATMEECALSLRRAGARKIIGLAFARAEN